jgi:threonine dehydratase
VKTLRPTARVIAVEPELSTALHEGLAAGHPVPVTPRSIADALSAPFAGEPCIEICRELGVESVLVDEDELAVAFRWLYGRMKLACEVGAAAPTAALLAGKCGVEPGQTVVSVVSGGNVAAPQAAAILAS